jgi:hypothetical protein
MCVGADGKVLGAFRLRTADGSYSKEIDLDSLVQLYQLDDCGQNSEATPMRVSAASGTFEYNGFKVDLWRHLAGEPKENVVTVAPSEHKMEERDPLLAALFRSPSRKK